MILKNYIFIFFLLFFIKVYSSEHNNNNFFGNTLKKIDNILSENKKFKDELKNHKEFYYQKYEKYKKFNENQLNKIIFKITLNINNKIEESIFLKELKDKHDKKNKKISNFIKIFPDSNESKYLKKLIENFEFFYEKKNFYLID